MKILKNFLSYLLKTWNLKNSIIVFVISVIIAIIIIFLPSASICQEWYCLENISAWFTIFPIVAYNLLIPGIKRLMEIEQIIDVGSIKKVVENKSRKKIKEFFFKNVDEELFLQAINDYLRSSDYFYMVNFDISHWLAYYEIKNKKIDITHKDYSKKYKSYQHCVNIIQTSKDRSSPSIESMVVRVFVLSPDQCEEYLKMLTDIADAHKGSYNVFNKVYCAHEIDSVDLDGDTKNLKNVMLAKDENINQNIFLIRYGENDDKFKIYFEDETLKDKKSNKQGYDNLNNKCYAYFKESKNIAQFFYKNVLQSYFELFKDKDKNIDLIKKINNLLDKEQHIDHGIVIKINELIMNTNKDNGHVNTEMILKDVQLDSKIRNLLNNHLEILKYEIEKDNDYSYNIPIRSIENLNMDVLIHTASLEYLVSKGVLKRVYPKDFDSIGFYVKNISILYSAVHFLKYKILSILKKIRIIDEFPSHYKTIIEEILSRRNESKVNSSPTTQKPS